MKKYKYRHELKFKISNSAAEVLKQKLSLILGKDKNAYYEDGSYLIKSLYFYFPFLFGKAAYNTALLNSIYLLRHV